MTATSSFDFYLAEKLGMTVAEMRRRVSWPEWVEWSAYYRDQSAAIVALRKEATAKRHAYAMELARTGKVEPVDQDPLAITGRELTITGKSGAEQTITDFDLFNRLYPTLAKSGEHSAEDVAKATKFMMARLQMQGDPAIVAFSQNGEVKRFLVPPELYKEAGKEEAARGDSLAADLAKAMIDWMIWRAEVPPEHAAELFEAWNAVTQARRLR